MSKYGILFLNNVLRTVVLLRVAYWAHFSFFYTLMTSQTVFLPVLPLNFMLMMLKYMLLILMPWRIGPFCKARLTVCTNGLPSGNFHFPFQSARLCTFQDGETPLLPLFHTLLILFSFLSAIPPKILASLLIQNLLLIATSHLL